MAFTTEHNQSLKDALIESLTAILSPDQKTRINGEDQVKALEVTEEYGIHLAELTIDSNGPLAIRQLSSVLLKQYVEAHWCSHSDKFRSPETSPTAKAKIRNILPVGLKESISKVRSSVAYAVSAIAHWDWPEVWPELFQVLMEALTSGDLNAVHGAMRVLAEFTQDVTDTQMVHVAPVILPEMYKIFVQDEVFGVRTRSRAVNIFNICAGMIATMSELKRGLAKQLLFPVLPQFTQAFVQALLVPDGASSDSGLKLDIMKYMCLQRVINDCDAYGIGCCNTCQKFSESDVDMDGPNSAACMEHIYTELKLNSYICTVVNNTEDADNPVDSDGEVLGFENLVYSVFEFIHSLLDSPKFRATVKKSMNDILYYIILYMQITEDQSRLWSLNPDQFVEDEDDDTFSYSVRISAQDLLMSIATEFEEDAGPGIVHAITKHLHEAETQKNTNNEYWWKVHESCMLCLGSLRNLIVGNVQDGSMQFDIAGFMESVVLSDMNLSVSPFLIGRCLWTASRYCECMNNDLLQRCLQATVGGIHPSQPPVIRISAIRAVYGYCEHLKNSNNTQLLVPFLPNITEGLVTVATQFSSDVLSLCLETLCLVLSVDKTFTASCESKVTPLSIAVFLKYCSDHVITSIVQDIFKELAMNENCMGPLQHRLLPTLVSIIQANPDKVAQGLPSAALDVITIILRSSQVPISDALVSSAFPAVAQCTLNTDDNSTMQSGGECIRAYASVGLNQVAQWHDEQGFSGLTYIVQVISKLLDPKTSEHTASFVGRLVTVVLNKAGGQLGEQLDLILRAVLSKMQQTETLMVMQSLLMIYARLMHDQMEAVLEFLTSVPDPMGKPALEFVLKEWCARQHLFYGAYERRVMVIALCKLLQHTVTHSDVRLKDITVEGDQIVPQTNGIRTRSKAAQAPVQWTTIPVVVKIYKLLINELNHQLESSMSTQQGQDPEDEDEEWEDEDDGGLEAELSGQTLSSLLDQVQGEFQMLADEVEDEEDDPDAIADPVNQINLQAYLTEFLQSFSQQSYYSMFSSNHTDAERQVLQSINIQA